MICTPHPILCGW